MYLNISLWPGILWCRVEGDVERVGTWANDPQAKRTPLLRILLEIHIDAVTLKEVCDLSNFAIVSSY